MTVYLAQVCGWDDQSTVGVFTTEEAALTAARAYIEEHELLDYGANVEKFTVQE